MAGTAPLGALSLHPLSFKSVYADRRQALARVGIKSVILDDEEEDEVDPFADAEHKT